MTSALVSVLALLGALSLGETLKTDSLDRALARLKTDIRAARIAALSGRADPAIEFDESRVGYIDHMGEPVDLSRYCGSIAIRSDSRDSTATLKLAFTAKGALDAPSDLDLEISGCSDNRTIRLSRLTGSVSERR